MNQFYKISTRTVAVLCIAGTFSLSFQATGFAEDDKKTPAKASSSVEPVAQPLIPLVKNATPVKLEVFPKDILLSNLRDRQSIIAQMVYSNGVTVDVTELVQSQIDTKTLQDSAQINF